MAWKPVFILTGFANQRIKIIEPDAPVDVGEFEDTRPENPNADWDGEDWKFGIKATGGGRYRHQLIAAGDGKVYYEDVQ